MLTEPGSRRRKNPNAALRPMLEVKSWPAALAGAASSPREGDLTGRWIKLAGKGDAPHQSPPRGSST